MNREAASQRGRALSPSLRDFLVRHGEQRLVEVAVQLRAVARRSRAQTEHLRILGIEPHDKSKTLRLPPRRIVWLADSPFVERIDLAEAPVILDQGR